MVYKFYIQPYPTAEDEHPRTMDLELDFNCKYRRFSNLLEKGEVKNIYSEEYAEGATPRMYIPAKADIVYKPTTCELQLLFDSETCQEDSLRFLNFVTGRLIEWHDTFRGIYATLLLTQSSQVEQEVLYGNRKYRTMKYTFSNQYGTSYPDSKINQL